MKVLIPAAFYIFVFFHFTAQAQQFNISWGDNSKATESIGDAIQLSSGNYLLLKFEKLKAFSITKDYTPNPILSLVDQDMRPVKETTFEIAEKGDAARALRKYGSNVFLTYEVYSDKQTSVYAVKLNQQTLLPETKITLGTFDYDNFGSQPDIIYKLSADSTNVLLFAEGSGKKRENKQIHIGVFDTNLKKIWSRYAELPIGGRAVSIEDQDITNDGKVFVAIKHYEKEIITALVKDKEYKVPPYEYKLFVCSKQGPVKQLSFDLANHFIEGTKLVYGKDGLVTAAGLYKKNHNGNITGVFYTRFDSTATVISKNQMLAFPPDILELVDKDGQGKSKGSDPGVYSFLRIKNILPRRNGTVDLVSEIQMVNSTTQTNSKELFYGKEYRNYVYGDIININLDKGGHAIFTRIPKRQEGYQSDWALGYYPIVYGDKLVLLYNDHEDNITRDLSKGPEHFFAAKKGVLAAAIIDDKGNLTRKIVFNFRDEKRLALPKNFSRMSDTQYFMVSVSGSFLSYRMGFGSLEIK